jgi:hypothetical protein
MKHSALIPALVLCLLSSSAFAAGTKKVDPLLEKAILDSADIKSDTILEPQMIESDETETVIYEIDNTEDYSADYEVIESEEYELADEGADFVDDTVPPELYIEENTQINESGADSERKQLGFKAGMFRLMPKLVLEEQYNDNILASPSMENDDFITVFKPSVLFELQNSRHEFAFDAGYHGEFYAEEDNENIDAWHVRTKGYLEAKHNLILPYHASFSVTHENREDDLTRQLPNERTRQKEWRMLSGFEWKPGKPSLALIGTYTRERFDDGTARDGSGVVIRRDADRATWEGMARLNYELNEDKLFYAQGVLANREYKRRNYQSGAFTGPFRDSDWYELRAGMATRMKKLKTDIGVGYKKWDYDDQANLNSKDDMTIHADLAWHAGERTTINFAWHRDLYEDDEVVNLIRRTDAEVGLDYDLTARANISLSGSYLEQKFEASAREDDTYGLHLKAQYEINPHLTAAIKYTVDSRDSSSGSAFEYDRQVVMARVEGDL